jgi:RNA polymerase sigma-70 factor (ECF subfamily)
MSITPEQSDNSAMTEEFLHLLMANQCKIRAYIAVLVPNYSDADDIMQETIAIMWRKFNEFELGTNFGSWGVRIAYLNTLHYYKKKGKYAIWADKRLFEQFVDVATKQNDNHEERLSALRECSRKLGDNERRLLHLRYELNKSIKDIAAAADRNAKYYYRVFGRIHNLLFKCIRRVLIERGVL